MQLTDIESKAIEKLKREILKIYPEAGVILFGSKARGDFNENSDIDILILMNKKDILKLEDDIRSIAYDIEFKYAFQIRISIIMESKTYWDSNIGKIEPFHKNIDREGIAL